MSYEAEQQRLNVAAGADLSTMQYKVISVAGTIAAVSTAAVGILQNKPKSGEQASVAYHGRMKGYAAAAIPVGKGVAVTTSGFIKLVQSGEVAVGLTLAAANSGDLVPIVANFISFTAITSGG